MDRGSSVYQDLFHIFYMVVTNAAIMATLIASVFLYMAHRGYKNITIKFKKDNKIIKQIKHNQKMKESAYISQLETKVKKKKHK